MLVWIEDEDKLNLSAVPGASARTGYEALIAPVPRPVETALALHQVVSCAVQAVSAPVVVERRAQVVTPRRAVRRVKAFFIAQKVNGRNAP